MNKRITSACMLVAGLGIAGTGFALPDNEYACKVQTKSMALGLVMVQAFDLRSAQSLAASAAATRVDGKSEGVQIVLECIRFPGSRFGDSEFQAFVDSMPR